MRFLESTTSRIVSGLVALGVVVGAITWWQTPAETRTAILTSLARIAVWLGIVLILPFAAIPLIGHVARKDSNAWSAALIASLTLAEALLLAWLLDFSLSGAAAWTLFLLGVLLAGAYNLLLCDFLAERI